ncbi:protease modulator HflC [bacterium]|nr:protease modulator HflC [bacterium]
MNDPRPQSASTSPNSGSGNSAGIESKAPDSGMRRSLLASLTSLLAIIWLSSCVLFVDESEVVVVERLGTITAVLDLPEQRGLNFKLPWPVGTVRRFDRRILLFDPPGREVFTRDRKNVTVDAYVCWKIADSPAPEASRADTDSFDTRPAVRFFRSLGSQAAAQARLETRVRSAIASRLALVELSDLMAVSDPESQAPVTDVSLASLADNLLADVRQRGDEDLSVIDRLGIEVVDVRIKRINFPLGNQQAVFERMNSERQKIADAYRSAGLAQNTVIRSQADRQYAEIMSKADAEAERIRGEAEAEALAILNAAHARDPEFYQTMRTLDAYRDILNEKTTLVLSTSSSLLRELVETPSAIVAGEQPNAKDRRPKPEEQNEGSISASVNAPSNPVTSPNDNASKAGSQKQEQR